LQPAEKYEKVNIYMGTVKFFLIVYFVGLITKNYQNKNEKHYQ